MSLLKVRIILASALLAAGCASEPRAPLVDAELPDAWRQPGQGAVVEAWLPTFNDPHLTGLVNRAIADNHGLAQQRALLDSARQQARLVRAARLPTLNLGLAGQRQRAFSSAPVNEQFDLSAVLNAPLDLWGVLGDAERQALLNLAAQEARYRDTELNLTANVVSAHYDAAAALQLQELLKERLANLVQSLDVIESGYRSGLNDALDVYLARNTLEQERANVASQRQVRMQAVANLELLLADYPAGRFAAGERLPHMVAPVGAGVPAELLNRRPDIQQAWLELLAADAGLAVAHKNRFPGLSLTANARDSDGSLGGALNGSALAWSVAASLTQPLFQGGRLDALHEQAKLRIVQLERRYLDTVYRAISQVETELSRTLNLAARHEAVHEAQASAEAALDLAFDLYQRGLVSYITVLESQRRAFDAQSSLIRLHNQLLQTRVNLLLALGGGY